MNNVIKRVWNQNRMVAIEDLRGMTFQAESGGHTFQISGVDDAGNVIALSGSVAGVFLRPDNTDVAITGSASGGVVSVTLPANCYDVPGRFGLTIFVTASGQKTAVYAAMGTVSRTSSGTVSPGTTADVVDLINRINAAVATIPASWTGLMADIAPAYSDAAVYPVGAYCYYNGDLYRCTTAITTAESWTAGHWTQAVLGNDVSDLKSALNSLDSEVLHFEPYSFTTSPGIILANNGAISSSSSSVYTTVVCAGYSFIEFETYAYGSNYGYAFYDDATRYIANTGTHTTKTERKRVEVPSGAKYFRICWNNSVITQDIKIGKILAEKLYEDLTTDDIAIGAYSDGTISGGGADSGSDANFKRSGYIRVYKDSTYTLDKGSLFRVNLYDLNKSPIEQIVREEGQTSFTVSQDGYVRIVCRTGSTANTLLETNNDFHTIAAVYKKADEIENSIDSISDRIDNTDTSVGSLQEDVNDLGTVVRTPATSQKMGMMSAQDKQKLDNMINPGSITIEGSGIYKNASAYGFLPTNTAQQNTDALQTLLEGGGLVIVDFPGTYKICASILLYSNTEIIFGDKVYIELNQNAGGHWPRHAFINEGAINGTYNENITIRNLHLITNGCPTGDDIDYVKGTRGFIAFKGITHLRLNGITILDSGASTYNIHVQMFDDVVIENINIESRKDGIHLGVGKNFIIRHCFLKTNDDGIALNAQDYPLATAQLGWIENGIVEDIHFKSAPDFNRGRGLYILGGSWINWSSGMTVRTYGDAAVSNGRIYRTLGTLSADMPTIVSTVQPNHADGIQTYSDGVTWYMLQDTNIGYDAGVRNIVFRDIYFERASNSLLTLNFDTDLYNRSFYPGSVPPINKNISLENLRMADNLPVYYVVNARMPFDALRLIDCDMESEYSGVYIQSVENSPSEERLLLSGTNFKSGNTTYSVIAAGKRHCVAKISNSLIHSGTTYTVSGSNLSLLANDIGITAN